MTFLKVRLSGFSKWPKPRPATGKNLKSYLGLGAGFLVAVLAISGGTIVACYGQPWAGAAIGGMPVAALVWAFLKGTNDRRAEQEAKARQTPTSRTP
jgi:threonine/homoserine/homoserine lactone efflux protein